MKKRFFVLKITILLLLLLISSTSFAANGLPFYDKLEFGLKLVKVIGGMIAIVSFIVGIYSLKVGRNEAMFTAIWFFLAGVLTANIEWLAEQFGFLQGVLF